MNCYNRINSALEEMIEDVKYAKKAAFILGIKK